MKCRNCGKKLVIRWAGEGNKKVKGYSHDKPSMTFEQLFDPKFDILGVCRRPEPKKTKKE